MASLRAGQTTFLTSRQESRPNATNCLPGSEVKNTTTAIPTYSMPSAVPYDESYAVVIVKQPLGQTCSVANSNGIIKTVVTPGVIVPPATTAVDVVTNPVNNINITCVNNA